jgi:regulator of sirC expression with transglutaminase-like and TPR domain
MSSTEIPALLQLLSDEDPSIREAASLRLLHHGPHGEASLRIAAESDDAQLRVRARSLLARVQNDRVDQELLAQLESPQFDLESAMILLARTEHAERKPDELRAELARLSDRILSAVQSATDARERAQCLGKVLHDQEHFAGNSGEYYDPRNSYVDQVLSRRLGIPISLSAIYILAGRRAGLSLCGVGMPMHFLVRYEEGEQTFLIDAYSGGRLLTRELCRALLAGFNHPFRDEYLRPVSDPEMFRRMLANLAQIYRNRGDDRRRQRILRFIEALNRRAPPSAAP